MRIGRWLAAVGAVAALAVGIWAVVRLQQTQRTVEQALTPVEVPLHALFPPDAHLVVTVRGLDEAYAELHAWWSEFEGTGVWWQLDRMWADERNRFPTALVEALTALDGQLAAAEARLGHRPTTAEFFEVYGRESAFALLPATTGAPHLLACTRLPDVARTDALVAGLGSVPELHRLPEAAHGYPRFEEPTDGDARRLFAVGGGFLFIADDADALGAVLERLAARVAPAGTVPLPPSLADDAILARVAPPGEAPPAVTCRVLRRQSLADVDPTLEPLDGLVDRAFVLAPDDPAVALALVRPGPGRWALRASFLPESTRPLSTLLPAGVVQAQLLVPTPAAAAEAAQAGLEQLRNKPLWAELEALVSDVPALTRLCEEAVPEATRPRPEVLARVQHDVRFLGHVARAFVTEAAGAAGAELAIVTKHYREPDAAEMVLAVTLGPDQAFVVAGGLDLAAERFPDWVTPRTSAGAGPLVWRTGFARMVAEASRNTPMPVNPWAGVSPVIVLAGRQLLVCTGERIAAETLAVITGAPGAVALADDPLFCEATAGLPPGAAALDFTRPAELLAGNWRAVSGMVDAAAGEAAMSQDARDVLRALTATVSAGFEWAAVQRASVTATYPSGDRPQVTRTLLDAALEGRVPVLEGPPGPVEVLGWLPDTTWWLQAGQTRPGPAYDALHRVFIQALPGGESRLQSLRRSAGLDGAAGGKWIDACIDDLLRNMDGPAGVALAMPPIPADAGPPPDPGAALGLAPGAVAFARLRDADAGWGALRTLLLDLEQVLNPEPFEARLLRAQQGLASAPLGARFAEGELGGVPVLALDILIPLNGGRQYLVPSICCLRREHVVVMTNSIPVWQQMAQQVKGGPGSLAARLRAELPASVSFGSVGRLGLLRADGVADHVEGVLQLFAGEFVPLSLGGYQHRPPAARLAAHEQGWRRAIALVCDLFRDGTWQVSADVREGATAEITTHVYRAR